MDGILLIDKPSGPSSFDVVRAVKRTANQRKVGHAGTLDPMASGLLAICLGQGTKLSPYLMEMKKRYRAQITLGSQTDTDDALGTPTAQSEVPRLTRSSVEEALLKFVGDIDQVAPAFSALKSGGEPLYKKARRGEVVQPKKRTVTIEAIQLLRLEGESIELDVRCGKGTYIRSLARDVGQALGTLGHLSALRRTEASGFAVERALSMAELQGIAPPPHLADHLISLADALVAMPKLTLSASQEQGIKQGQPIPLAEVARAAAIEPQQRVALIGPEYRLCAIAECTLQQIRPIRVFP